MSGSGPRSLALRETDSIPAKVVCSVPFAEEAVTDDPEWADRSGDVHASEGGDTASARVQDVVRRAELVRLSAESERHFGQGGDAVTVDGVCAVP